MVAALSEATCFVLLISKVQKARILIKISATTALSVTPNFFVIIIINFFVIIMNFLLIIIINFFVMIIINIATVAPDEWATTKQRLADLLMLTRRVKRNSNLSLF